MQPGDRPDAAQRKNVTRDMAPFLRVVCLTCAWNTLIRIQSHAVVRPGKCGYCGSSRLVHAFVSHFDAFIAGPMAYLVTLLRRQA